MCFLSSQSIKELLHPQRTILQPQLTTPSLEKRMQRYIPFLSHKIFLPFFLKNIFATHSKYSLSITYNKILFHKIKKISPCYSKIRPKPPPFFQNYTIVWLINTLIHSPSLVVFLSSTILHIYK